MSVPRLKPLLLALLIIPALLGTVEGEVQAATAVSYDTFGTSFNTAKWVTSFAGSESKRSVTVSSGRLHLNADGRGAPDDTTKAEVVSVSGVGKGVAFDMTGTFGGGYNFGLAGITDGTKYIEVMLNRYGNGDNVILVGMSGYTQLENSAEYDTSTIPFTEGTIKSFTIEEINGEIKVMMDSTVLARFTGTFTTAAKFRALARSAAAPDRYAFLDIDNVSFFTQQGSSSSASSSSSAQSSSQASSTSSASSSSSSSSQAPATPPILFSLPDFPDNGRVMEGDWVKTEVKNGIPQSAIYIDVLYDGNIVYSHGFAETDTSGNGFVRFQMPYKLLKSGYTEDGLVIRMNHGDAGVSRPFTLIQGLDIIVPKEIREGTQFTYEVYRSAGETLVRAGIDYDAGPDHQFPDRDTNGSGDATITVTMPKLITNGANSDGAEFWVQTKDVKWYFPFTIVKGQTQTEAKATVGHINAIGGGTVYPVPTPGPSPATSTWVYTPQADGSTGFPASELLNPNLNYSSVGTGTPTYSWTKTVTVPVDLPYKGIAKKIFENIPLAHFEHQLMYFARILDSKTAEVSGVSFKPRIPSGITGAVCAQVEVYSQGTLVNRGPESCKAFGAGTQEGQWLVYLPNSNSRPRVRRSSNEIRTLFRYSGTSIGGDRGLGGSAARVDTLMDAFVDSLAELFGGAHSFMIFLISGNAQNSVSIP